jgi:hypothetical protein
VVEINIKGNPAYFSACPLHSYTENEYLIENKNFP